MADYIDRQLTIKAMSDSTCDRDSAGYAYMFVGDAVALLETQPSADVVEVVRCKDCKYNGNQDGLVECSLFYAMGDQNGFCSFGERRLDG